MYHTLYFQKHGLWIMLLRNTVKAVNLSPSASASSIPSALRELASGDPPPLQLPHLTSICAHQCFDKSSCRAFWEQELKLHLFQTQACRCLFFLHPFPVSSFCAIILGFPAYHFLSCYFPRVGSFPFPCPICLIHLRAESRKEERVKGSQGPRWNLFP